jgi:hypothetical protein
VIDKLRIVMALIPVLVRDLGVKPVSLKRNLVSGFFGDLLSMLGSRLPVCRVQCDGYALVDIRYDFF